jgi:hypothetical protein
MNRPLARQNLSQITTWAFPKSSKGRALAIFDERAALLEN